MTAFPCSVFKLHPDCAGGKQICENRGGFAFLGRLLLFLIIYKAREPEGKGGMPRWKAADSGGKSGDLTVETMKFRFFLLVFSNKKHFFT